jgi:hypothetical protein
MSGFDVDAHFEAGDAAGALLLIRTVWGQHMTHDKPFYSGASFEGLARDGTPAGAGLTGDFKTRTPASSSRMEIHHTDQRHLAVADQVIPGQDCHYVLQTLPTPTH